MFNASTQQMSRREEKEDSRRQVSPKLTLIGYYGYDNLGDHLMLTGLLRMIHEDGRAGLVRVIVKPGSRLTPTMGETIPVPATLSGRLRRIAMYASADAVIWGGGTSLYEDGPGGIAGIASMLRTIRFCRLMRKPFHLLGVGIGDIHTSKAMNIVKTILEEADGVYVRDEGSAEKCIHVSGRCPDMVMGDMAFLTDVPSCSDLVDDAESGRQLAFCGASYFASDDEVVSIYRSALRRALDHEFDKILFVPMHQGEGSDRAFHEAVAEGLAPGTFQHVQYGSVDECVRVLAGCRGLIGFRLHSVVLADMLALPNIAVAYSNKVEAYVRKSGIVYPGRICGLRDDLTTRAIEDMIPLYREHEDRRRIFIQAEREEAATGVQHLLGRLAE